MKANLRTRLQAVWRSAQKWSSRLAHKTVGLVNRFIHLGAGIAGLSFQVFSWASLVLVPMTGGNALATAVVFVAAQASSRVCFELPATLVEAEGFFRALWNLTPWGSDSLDELGKKAAAERAAEKRRREQETGQEIHLEAGGI